jgi:type II secretory pathway pseudopilin PulG
VALLVLITVANIAIAAALQPWTQAMKREREAELVFRGLQYAEAIRVFQQRFGRYPVKLQELVEVSPRCIRQLWKDPFSEEGKWALVLAQQRAAGRRVAGAGGPQAARRRGLGAAGRDREQDLEETAPQETIDDPGGGRRRPPRAGEVVTRGPILGVRSLSDEESIRSFMGSTRYNEWIFMVDLIPTLAAPVLGENVPRLHSNWVGRPFPEDVTLPAGGTLPGDQIERSNPLDSRRKRGLGSQRSDRSKRNSRDSGS